MGDCSSGSVFLHIATRALRPLDTLVFHMVVDRNVNNSTRCLLILTSPAETNAIINRSTAAAAGEGKVRDVVVNCIERSCGSPYLFTRSEGSAPIIARWVAPESRTASRRVAFRVSTTVLLHNKDQRARVVETFITASGNCFGLVLH